MNLLSQFGLQRTQKPRVRHFGRFWSPHSDLSDGQAGANCEPFSACHPQSPGSNSETPSIHAMIKCRGLDFVDVFKVKGHADQFPVADGSVRLADLVGLILVG